MKRYLSALESRGLISASFRGRIKPYVLTQEGLEFLRDSGSKRFLSGGLDELLKSFTLSAIQTPRFEELHNLSFKFDIRRLGDIWMPNEVQLNNWVKKYDWFGDALVSVYGKSSLEVRFKVKCRDPHEATWRAWNQVLRFAEAFQRAYGVELGYPVMNRRPVHYTHRSDGAVEELSKGGVTYVEGVGHIDRSKDTGELEYYSPEDSKKYILLPRSVDEIKEHQERQREQLNMIVLALDDLRRNTPRLDTLKKESEDEDVDGSLPPKELYG